MSISSVSGKVFERTLSGSGAVSQYAKRFFNSKFNEAINEPAKFASDMLLTSIVSKDLVGCFVYTVQSYNNKKIPEDKRAAVAGYDFVNGLLMVLGQVAAGKLVQGLLTPKLFGKLYSGFFKNKDTGAQVLLKGPGARDKSRLFRDNILNTVKQTISEDKVSVNETKILNALEHEIGAKSKVRYKLFEAGFGIVVTALATTALVKRTIAPLFSTPLSALFGGKSKSKAKPEEAMTPAMIDSTMPKAKIDKTI